MYYIYKITNNVNNKIYIGKTEKTVEARFTQHIKNSLDYDSKSSLGSSHLYAAMHKYGWENFSVEQIDSATSSDELCEKEIYWIKFYNSTDNKIGYNIASGGTGGNLLKGYSDEEKKIVYNSRRGKKPWNLGLRKKDYASYKKKKHKQRKSRKDLWTPERRKEHSEKVRNGIAISKLTKSEELKDREFKNRSNAAKKRSKTKEFKDMIDKHNKNNMWGAKCSICIYNNKEYTFTSRCEAAKWMFNELKETYKFIKSWKSMLRKISESIKSGENVVLYTPGSNKKCVINMIWKKES